MIVKNHAAWIVIASMLVSSVVRADQEIPPTDYYKITRDQKHIFVMLAPKGKSSEKNKTLRKQYNQSGLYPNNGSGRPLWMVDWYAFSIYASSDGTHLVRMGSWPRVIGGEANLEQLAFSFYENGKLIRHYMISDLVTNPAVLEVSDEHFNWIKDLTFDDESGQLKVLTLDAHPYTFEVKTGEMLKP